MINSYQSTPLDDDRKDLSSPNQNTSEQSESSTGESQYKDEISDRKKYKKIKNKKYKKNENEKENKICLLYKKVKRNLFFDKKENKNNSNKNNNIIYNIFNEFKSSFSFNKFPQFNQVEKHIKNDIYLSPLDFATDLRNIFSKIFTSSLTNLDSDKYSKILIISEIFENIFEKYEKNSQNKQAQKLADEMAKLKKEIAKLTRKKNFKNGCRDECLNLEEKKETSMKEYRDDIINKINKLNIEQKKGILNIISDNLVNKNCENNIVEFNINKLPLNQLKQLDLYINKCIINNINNISNNQNAIIGKTNEIMDLDELSNSSCDSSDSESLESLDFE